MNSCIDCICFAPCNPINGVGYCEINLTYLDEIIEECNCFEPIDI